VAPMVVPLHTRFMQRRYRLVKSRVFWPEVRAYQPHRTRRLALPPVQEQVNEPRGRRQIVNETCCCAHYSRQLGLVSALLLALWPAGGASAVGELGPSEAQAASPAVAESHSQEASQWNLQMERKWKAGHSSRYPPLDRQGRAANLPSPVATPTLDETPDANDPAYGTRTLRRYISVIERPPAALHIAPAAEPKIDIAVEAATPAAPDPKSPILKPKPTPDIVVTRTVWHPFAELRTVRVEVSGGAPVELNEGGRAGLFEVGTIEPSGVIFRYDGVEIFRKVGEIVARQRDPDSEVP